MKFSARESGIDRDAQPCRIVEPERVVERKQPELRPGRRVAEHDGKQGFILPGRVVAPALVFCDGKIEQEGGAAVERLRAERDLFDRPNQMPARLAADLLQFVGRERVKHVLDQADGTALASTSAKADTMSAVPGRDRPSSVARGPSSLQTPHNVSVAVVATAVQKARGHGAAVSAQMVGRLSRRERRPTGRGLQRRHWRSARATAIGSGLRASKRPRRCATRRLSRLANARPQLVGRNGLRLRRARVSRSLSTGGLMPMRPKALTSIAAS